MSGGIYASKNICVKDIGSRASMVLQNYQKLIEITSNLIYVFALGVGLKCPREINLNTLWGGLVMWWSQSAFHLVGKGLIGLEKSEWPPFLPDSNGPG